MGCTNSKNVQEPTAVPTSEENQVASPVKNTELPVEHDAVLVDEAAKKPYLLQIDVSPMEGNSVSKKLAASYVEAYQNSNPGVELKYRDLSTDPLAHIDAETIGAAYVPEDQRPATQQAKHQLRLDLIQEITGAGAIVISTPMWNWSIPSVLKAYIDQIVLVGSLDAYGAQGLAGKQVTFLVATGGGGYGGDKADTDFVTSYLKHSTFLFYLLPFCCVSSLLIALVSCSWYCLGIY